jgi:hypothetical protein
VRDLILSSLFAALLGAPLHGLEAPPRDGRDLAERFFTRPRGEDARLELDIRIQDRKGREKAMRLLSLRRSASGLDHTLLRFMAPAEIAGVSVLVREKADGPSERLLYLPAVGKVRKVAPSRRDESFAGSDFSFEDIAGRRLDDYDYVLLPGTEEVAGRAALRLQLRPRDPKARFERTLWWIDAERMLLLRGEVYERGVLARLFTASEAERVDGIWLQRRLTMEDMKRGSRTTVRVVEAAFSRGVLPSLLTETALTESGAPGRGAPR